MICDGMGGVERAGAVSARTRVPNDEVDGDVGLDDLRVPGEGARGTTAGISNAG